VAMIMLVMVMMMIIIIIIVMIHMSAGTMVCNESRHLDVQAFSVCRRLEYISHGTNNIYIYILFVTWDIYNVALSQLSVQPAKQLVGDS
jgi:hypothetical protein